MTGRMRLLDRYLLREFLIPLGYCTAGFLLFWVGFDLFEDVERFRGLGIWDVVQYYLIRVPELFWTIMPMALLLAALYALSNHARHQELTAIRAAGISLWRISVPYLVIGFVCSVFLMWINETLVPQSIERSEEILARRKDKKATSHRWVQDVTFLNEAAGRLWHIGLYDRKTGHMWSVLCEWPRKDGSRVCMAAGEGIYSNGVWVFRNVKQLIDLPGPPPQRKRMETNQIAMPEFMETPEEIESEIEFRRLDPLKAVRNPQLSLRQILAYRRLHPRLSPETRAKLMTQFHARLAEPWRCLIVILLAIPLAAQSGRRNVFASVAFSIFLVFGYFVVAQFSLGLGTGGKIPPWLAAWFPCLLFLGIGLGLMFRVQ